MSFGSFDSSVTDTISAIDPSKTWLMYSVRTDDGTATNIGQKGVRGRVTNGTTLTFDRSATGQAMTVAWFAVEFTDATEVQHASSAFPSFTATSNVAITAVDTGRSIAVGGYLNYGGRTSHTTTTNPGYGWFGTRLTSSTNLEIRRDATGATADLGWFVVHWPAGNNPPVAVDDADSTSQDTAVIVDVLANDSDPDTDPLTVDSVTQGTNGSVVNSGTDVTYTPNASWTGVDTFTYTATDSNGGFDTATVTVTVFGAGLFVVNSTGDAGDTVPGNGVCFTGGTNTQGAAECTLRAAIEEANAYGAIDTIEFNIPTSEPGYTASPLAFTLTPTSAYPSISAPATLDATTQPGYTGDPIIQLDGTGAVGATAGLAIVTDDSVIKGFIVHSFADEGLEIDGLPGLGDNNTLSNNWVGIDASGTVRGNTDNGILVSESASGNMIGGTGPFDGNVVAGSSNQGILIRWNCVDNTVIGNSVYGNTGLGIDLGEDGVTLNDPGDGDSGGNDLLNFPVITSANESGGTITVDFDLDVPPGNYRIEFFTNTVADPSGYGEGETFVAFYDVVGHLGGSASYSTSFAGSIGDILTATTTEGTSSPFGPTSEYSATHTVTNTPPAFVPPLADQTDPEGPPLISLSVAATDPEGETLTYSATGLPLGLSIDSGTGLITGLINHTAAASNPHNVEVTVSDGVNAPVSGTFIWTITDVPTTPPYVVAGSGGANGGDDLLTAVNPVNTDPATNEVDIGTGTGTSSIEAIAIEPFTNVVFAVDGGQLGTLNIDSGVFAPVGTGIGAGDGAAGTVVMDQVVGLAFHPLFGRLYGVHQRPGDTDLLFQINTATGTIIPNAWFGGRDYAEIRTLGALEDVTDIAFDPASWQMYGVMTDGTPAGQVDLVTIRRWNGMPRSVGPLAEQLTGLSFNTAGQLWGTDVNALYSVDKTSGVLGSPRPLDNGAQYGALDFGIGPASPPALEGTVFEDVDGNLLAGTELIEDMDNPGIAAVTVHLYEDDGTVPNEPDAGDTLYASTVTGPTGHYFFSAFPAGSYWIVVDSSSVTPLAGGTGWAEQTYGPAGSVTYNGSTYSFSAGGGARYGGKQPAASDDASALLTSEHLAFHTFLVTEVLEEVDFGFSFNVVTNLAGGDGTSPQGSLRQFLSNANTGTGPNSMRFVPVVPTNATDGTNDWWNLAISATLPMISGGDTTVDGTAYDSSDGATVLNPNGAGPELEIDGPGAAPAMDGLTVASADNAVRNLVVGGFTDVSRAGVLIIGVSATGNTIAGNYVGTTAAGTAANGNRNGIHVTGGATGNTIGGAALADRNVISGNLDNGVLVNGGGTDGNATQGNYIGTDAGGSNPLGNGLMGVALDAGAADNRIGGIAAGSGNTVAYNGSDGVGLEVGAGSGNAILGNSIFSNTGMGLDLASDGVTLNDGGDGDSGPNDLLNFPVITSAVEVAGTVTVDFDLDAPAGDYRIEFFTNTAADPTGYGEGETFVASYDVVTHPGGSASYSTAFAGVAGDILTVTATEGLGGSLRVHVRILGRLHLHAPQRFSGRPRRHRFHSGGHGRGSSMWRPTTLIRTGTSIRPPPQQPPCRPTGRQSITGMGPSPTRPI